MTALASNPIHANMESGLAAGLSVFPCDDHKQPDARYLPRGADGKPTNKPFFVAPPDDEIFGRWMQADLCGYGIACGPASGGLLAIDFEIRAAFLEWLAAVGDLAKDVVIQDTPGGGVHVIFRVDVPAADFPYRNDKLAWIADESEKTGRKVLIETRAAGGYIMGPDSAHPNGGTYRLTRGSLDNIPTISKAHADALLDAARRLDKCPLTRQQRERMEKAKERKEITQANSNGSGDVIGAYDRQFKVRDILSDHGYTAAGPGRMLRPGAEADSQPGVVFFKRGEVDVCFAWSSNDVLNDGHCHSAFSAFCKLEHGDDCGAAVKAAAKLLGIEHRLHGATDQHQRAGDENPSASEPILLNMADVEARRVPWLWKYRFPQGRLSMIVGMQGTGKSFCVTDITARITRGTDWPDGERCEAGDVLMISGEDDPHDQIRPRLDACGADVSKVTLLRMVRRIGEDGKPFDVTFTLADVLALEAALKRLPNCKLVIVDPIGSFLGGGIDMHRDNEVRGILTPLAQLAERYNVAVLIIAHRRKAAASYADDTALGSRAFTALCRMVWHLSRDRDNRERRLLLPGKCNLCAEPTGLAFTIESDPARIVWEADAVEMTADEAMNGETAEQPSDQSDEVEQWLRGELADLGEHPVDDIRKAAKEAGVGWRMVQRARKEIGAIFHRAQFGGAYIWRMPKPALRANLTKEKKHVTQGTHVTQEENP